MGTQNVLNISTHQENGNQNHSKISPYTCYNIYYQKGKRPNAGEDVGQKGPIVYCWWEYKSVRLLQKNSIEIPQESKSRTTP